MSKRVFSRVTIRALLRLYGVELHELPDGRCSGLLPRSVRPGAELSLSANGGTWSTNDESPLSGDRLDLIMHMECVSRNRASELLHDVFPAVLAAEHIPPDFAPTELRRGKQEG